MQVTLLVLWYHVVRTRGTRDTEHVWMRAIQGCRVRRMGFQQRKSLLTVIRFNPTLEMLSEECQDQTVSDGETQRDDGIPEPDCMGSQ